MIRFGLCCIFRKEPIKFRRTTAKFLSQSDRKKQLNYISEICGHNAKSLLDALIFCKRHGIQDFRVNSQILPLKTHPDVGYQMEDLPHYRKIIDTFRECGVFSRENDLRTTFHPDQFILLSSPNKDVTRRSLAELQYQAEVAKWINADVINIHGGGAYGNKTEALQRLVSQTKKMPDSVRIRLTLENDDRIYTPKDLLPVCVETGIPLVYDVHHHRCLPDGLSVEKATELAMQTWNREPLFHLSSPLNGWEGNAKNKHHDYIEPRDFPDCWLCLDITVEVEAKAKELAVLKLKKHIDKSYKKIEKS
ncbi:UV DNA damage repair endonuclease UvsE [Thermodesulfobacteriota bacterium]